MNRWIGALCCIGAMLSTASRTEATKTRISYARQIQPIFTASCAGCHGPAVQQAGLRLDSVDGVLRGATSGLVVMPGNSAGSRLVVLISGSDAKLVMPPNGPRLPAAQVK